MYCLWREDVHTLSIGAARPSDFDAHLDILPLLGRQAELLPPVLARLGAAVDSALGPDWTAHWHSDLPAPDEVPGVVNLYQVLRLYTLTKAYDMTDFGRMRYNLFGNGGHWFYGQKVDALDFAALPAVPGPPPARGPHPGGVARGPRAAGRRSQEAPERELSADAIRTRTQPARWV